MDRRDFLKTLAVTGAVMTVQRSEAMDILAQKLTNAGGGKVDLVGAMAVDAAEGKKNEEPCWDAEVFPHSKVGVEGWGVLM